jgi:O-antigen ligase
MRSLTTRVGGWFPVVLALAMPTLFLPNLVDAFILPRVSLVIAGACVGTGIAILVVNKPGLDTLRRPLIAACVAALVAFAFSVSWPLSLTGSYTRYESLPTRLAYIGLMAVPVWLLRTNLQRTFVVVALVVGTAIASLEAVAQWWIHVPFRPDGNLGNANLLGALIAMALPLSIAGFVRMTWAAPLWLVASAAMVAGLVVSTSRGGALAALAGCLALGVFAARGRTAVIIGAGATLVVALALAAILFSPLRELNGDPGPTRQHLYPDAVRMIAARPIAGWGEDATGLVFGRFLTGDWSPGVTFDRAHSGLLDLGATQGLVGPAATGWVVIVVLGGLWRYRHRARLEDPPAPRLGTVGAIGASLVAYTVWVAFNFDWAPATGAFWLLAGTGWSAVRATQGEDLVTADELVARRRFTVLALRGLGAVGLVLVAIGLAALPILAEAYYSEGRSDMAVRVDPLQAQYHRAYGERLIGQGLQTQGIEELRTAGRLGETDPSLYVELGDEELKAGNAAQARADYQAALTIDPYWLPAKQRLAGNGGLATA